MMLDSMTNKLRGGTSLALLLARICVGLVFVISGLGKLGDLSKVTGFFTQLGIPFPAFNAVFVASCELIFGLCVIAGFFIELAVIPLTVIMIVAIVTAKLPEIKSLTDFLGMEEFLFIVMFIWFFTEGAGRYSIDAFRKHQVNFRGAVENGYGH